MKNLGGQSMVFSVSGNSYTRKKQPLDNNQCSEFCQSGVEPNTLSKSKETKEMIF